MTTNRTIRSTGDDRRPATVPRFAFPALAAAALIFCGCGADDSEAAPAATSAAPTSPANEVGGVAVSLDEYVVDAPTGLAAGSATLSVVNDGTENHQLTIVAAESYEALPQRENGSIEMEQIDPAAVVVSTGPFFAGFAAEQVDVDLDPGTYVFFCNIQSFSGEKSHAGLGQWLVVDVTGAG